MGSLTMELAVKTKINDPAVMEERRKLTAEHTPMELGNIGSLADFPIPTPISNLFNKPAADTPEKPKEKKKKVEEEKREKREKERQLEEERRAKIEKDKIERRKKKKKGGKKKKKKKKKKTRMKEEKEEE